jgi:hypothetical protein
MSARANACGRGSLPDKAMSLGARVDFFSLSLTCVARGRFIYQEELNSSNRSWKK